MFDTAYVEKLFTPQEVYSLSTTRKIFEKLAHSSIMRLSESSMDKLFDLMAMVSPLIDQSAGSRATPVKSSP